MSLMRWLKKSERSCPLPSSDSEATCSANRELEKAVDAFKRRRKRGAYIHYSDQLRAKIAKYACENGNTAAAARFSLELGSKVSESSVRNMKKEYLQKLQEEPDPDNIVSLPRGSRGRPLMLGRYDCEVADYIRSLRAAGGIVNRNSISQESISSQRAWGSTYLGGKVGRIISRPPCLC